MKKDHNRTKMSKLIKKDLGPKQGVIGLDFWVHTFSLWAEIWIYILEISDFRSIWFDDQMIIVSIEDRVSERSCQPKISTFSEHLSQKRQIWVILYDSTVYTLNLHSPQFWRIVRRVIETQLRRSLRMIYLTHLVKIKINKMNGTRDVFQFLIR